MIKVEEELSWLTFRNYWTYCFHCTVHFSIRRCVCMFVCVNVGVSVLQNAECHRSITYLIRLNKHWIWICFFLLHLSRFTAIWGSMLETEEQNWRWHRTKVSSGILNSVLFVQTVQEHFLILVSFLNKYKKVIVMRYINDSILKGYWS